MILESLLKHLLEKFEPVYQPKLIEYAAKYDHMMAQGSKEIFFIEAFLAHAMMLAAKQKKNIAP